MAPLNAIPIAAPGDTLCVCDENETGVWPNSCLVLDVMTVCEFDLEAELEEVILPLVV